MASSSIADAAYKSQYDAQHHLQLAFLAAAVLGTWDIIVTLNQERNLVWPRRISLVKVAYLLNRYYWLFGLVPLCGAAVFAHFSQSTCENGYWFVHPVSCVLALFAPQIILVFRVCAIYNWNRFLTAALTTLVVLGQVSVFVIISRLDPAPMLEGIAGCDIQVKQGHHFVWTLWLPSVLVETLCFSLVVGKYFSARSMGAASDLLGRLAVDSFLYYVPIVILSIANILLFALRRGMSSMALLMYPMIALSVTLSARLVLSLHADTLDGDYESFGSLQSRILSFIKGRNGSQTNGSRLGSGVTSSTSSSSVRDEKPRRPSTSAGHVVVFTETKTVSEVTSSQDLEKKRFRFDEEV